MGIEIRKIDHEDRQVKARVFDFLAPCETHALFILGNLNEGFPGSHLYVAERGGQWLGIAAYYERPKALIPFSHDAEVVRKLTRHVAERHAPIEYMNGISYAAEPAYEELLAMGFQPDSNPHMIFMELDGVPPRQPHEDLARPVTEGDLETVVRLLRLLRKTMPHDAPVTEGELARIRGTMRYALVVKGCAVATAATNGIGISAFQILGVATHVDHRCKGYARAVCAALTRRMMGQGATKAVLFTDVDNVAAQACYDGLGFRVTGKYYVARLKAPG
jgi:ribosomal protein S18 acetylase RimI-like enzyme